MSEGLVLIAEDDVDLQPLLEFTFDSRGYETVVFDNGEEAWRYLQEADEAGRPAAMVLDLIMPDVGGLELLKRCEDDPTLAETPTVVLTALDSEEYVDEAFDAGADDYVTKPFSPSELLTRVERLLGRV